MLGMVSTCPVWLNVPSPTFVHLYSLGAGLDEVTRHVIDNVSPVLMLWSGIVCIVGGSVSLAKSELKFHCSCFTQGYRYHKLRKTFGKFFRSYSELLSKCVQYDPLIIETTIGLVLGNCTALCRLFLKHCTLTNKAAGTIWRALSKPPQRRQDPDLRPLWLLVGTPSAIRPELAFSRAEHSLPYSDVTIYIFAILYLSSMPYV